MHFKVLILREETTRPEKWLMGWGCLVGGGGRVRLTELNKTRIKIWAQCCFYIWHVEVKRQAFSFQCVEMVLPGREKCVDADHHTLRNMLMQAITHWEMCWCKPLHIEECVDADRYMLRNVLTQTITHWEKCWFKPLHTEKYFDTNHYTWEIFWHKPLHTDKYFDINQHWEMCWRRPLHIEKCVDADHHTLRNVLTQTITHWEMC